MERAKFPIGALLSLSAFVSLIALSARGETALAGWHATPVPGGVPGLAAAAGVDSTTPRWRLLRDLALRLHAPYSAKVRGAAPVQELRAYFDSLNSVHTAREASLSPGMALGEGPSRVVVPRRPAKPDSAQTLPLPLDPRAWGRLVVGRPLPPERVVAAVLTDRRASLLCLGLMSLDEPTRTFFSSHPRLLKRIYEGPAEVFSVFARSLSVRGEELMLPGGESMRRPWERVVGMHMNRIDDFIVALLEKDSGRVAFLFDTLARLEAPRQRFALGADAAPEPLRTQRLTGLKDLFEQAAPWWLSSRPPYSRRVPDAALVLRVVPIGPEGRLVVPVSVARAVDGHDELPVGMVSRNRTPASADDAGLWLLRRLALGADGRELLARLTFASRVFGSFSPERAEDVVTTLRGMGRFRSLALTLERLGAGDPAYFARMVRHAAVLSNLAPEEAGVVHGELQGALALIARAHWTRVLESAPALRLAEQLFEIRVQTRTGHGGGVARWMEEYLLPLLHTSTYGSLEADSAERVVLRALSGARLRSNSHALVEWEGLHYRVDWGEAELVRLEAVRRAQRGPRLDEVLDFCRGARQAARSASPPEEAALLVARFRELARGLPRSENVLALLHPRSDAAHNWRATASALVAGADLLLADVLRSLAYAPHLGRPDGPALAAHNLARQHVFDVGQVRAGRGRGPWSVPVEVGGAGQRRHLRGSLLGLEFALGRLTLRRLSTELPLHPPALFPRLRTGFTLAAVLMNPHTVSDSARDTLAKALAHGRERLRAAGRHPRRLDELAQAAGLPAWRRQILPWVATWQPEQLEDVFTLEERVRLGAGAEEAAADWGVPAVDVRACWRLVVRAWGWQELLGVSPDDPFVQPVPDLSLRVAVELARLRLPAALAPGVLRAAVRDLIDEAQPVFPRDRMSLARYVAGLTRERMEDYVSSLVLNGPLRPIFISEGP